MAGGGQDQDGSAGLPPSRRDKRVYLALMTVCIGLFVLSWAVLDQRRRPPAPIMTGARNDRRP